MNRLAGQGLSERPTRAAEAARHFAENTAPVIREIQGSGVASLRGVAAALNARGVRTARGGRWVCTCASSTSPSASASACRDRLETVA